MVKNPPAKAGDRKDTGSILGLGRSPGGRNGNPLQYSCLGNFHWQRSLVGYSPWSPTGLSDWTHTHSTVEMKDWTHLFFLDNLSGNTLVPCMLLQICQHLLLLFSHWVVSDSFAVPWTVARQTPSVHGIFQELVAISFSWGSSRPRDRTWVFCIAGRFFTTEPAGKLRPTSTSMFLMFKRLWGPIRNQMYFLSAFKFSVQSNWVYFCFKKKAFIIKVFIFFIKVICSRITHCTLNCCSSVIFPFGLFASTFSFSTISCEFSNINESLV